EGVGQTLRTSVRRRHRRKLTNSKTEAGVSARLPSPGPETSAPPPAGSPTPTRRRPPRTRPARWVPHCDRRPQGLRHSGPRGLRGPGPPFSPEPSRRHLGAAASRARGGGGSGAYPAEGRSGRAEVTETAAARTRDYTGAPVTPEGRGGPQKLEEATMACRLSRPVDIMTSGNRSHPAEFLLLGLSDDPALQPLLFGLFLSTYLVTVLGNLLIILAIGSAPHLHTPMYFFLSNLSLVDICFTSTTVPKMLVNLQTQDRSISYPGCLAQIGFVLTFVGYENGILVSMAFDRFVAICHPLRYNVIMNPRLCGLLLLLSFLVGVLDALLHTLMTLHLSFCTDLKIPHFFCELAHILKLACSDILINNIFVYLVTSLLGVIPISGIIFSYVQIVSSVLKIPSTGGKYKAFSICGSHLIVVSLFYGAGFGVYLSSASTHASRNSAIVSVMYTVITPMMNPFIYSLRNKDMMSPTLLVSVSLDGAAASGLENRIWMVPTVHLPTGSIEMGPRNKTGVPEFLLLEVTADPALQPLLFTVFLSVYTVTLLGNLLIVLTVAADSRLHNPMHCLLCTLSFTDVCFSTTIIPEMLANLRAQSRGITYAGCLTQTYFVLVFASLESSLLAIMAYDRYVAICHPLRYGVIMTPCLCGLLVLGSACLSVADALLHSLMLLPLAFCTRREIPLFFCEAVQLIQLACSDTLINNVLIYLATGIFGGAPLCGIFFSYTQIVSSVLRIPSADGKYKAFSTCGSHLSVVSLFYGTGLGVYVSSALTDSSRNTAVASMVYTVVPQMLNPFIYSLRNRDMKGAIFFISFTERPLSSASRGIVPMEPRNRTSALEFLLLGLTENADQETLLFVVFLFMYVVTAVGNLLIILAISADAHLHTPMYLLLANLSLVDFCLATNTVPKMLVSIQTGSKSISYACCLAQMYFFHFFGIMDSVLIAVMAYDRFVAICHPLRYASIMSPRRCGLLVGGPWALSCLLSLTHILLMARLVFCGSHALPHYFCDLTPLLRLSCSDTTVNQVFVLAVAGLVIATPFACILASYARILAAVLQAPSAGGRRKAFSTCSSHLSVVALFFGTTIGVYLCPSSVRTAVKEKASAVMYTAVTPMLNPFIYSLRNRDLKGALRRLVGRRVSAAEIFFISFTERPLSSASRGIVPMEPRNRTSALEFLLLGLTENADQETLLFVVFLFMYVVTAVGNLLIILAISADAHLHTPMYLLLANLSLVDFCLATNTVPKMLVSIQTGSKSISYACCLAQMYFFHFFGIMDSVLIAVMAYDRFVAICHPLRYASIMSPRRCGLLVGGPWALSCLLSLTHILLMARLVFCGSHALPHYFCDLTPLLRLSCSDTTVNQVFVLAVAGLVIATPFACILASYARILAAVLQAPSAGGRRKAFSTCSSHLSVVALFFGTTIGVYLCPSSVRTAVKEKASAVMYTAVTPMLNPFIYSLRNRDLKGALRRLVGRRVSAAES
ncbi:Olfactory receptor 24, partial [Galemys pyrenaicus]